MINCDLFMHESDRAALKALKAIPGFTALFKAFMKVWSEKQFRIQNMSTNLRISEKQLPKYYEMLVPICEKLGIEVPELYMELNVVPNAYTAGDTKPFIVLTSGLIETMPEKLISTVIAHECGHIACRHCLYSTMGRVILSEAINFLGLGDLAVFPIQVAFSYWMRCSEFSADRVAAICDGSSDGIVEMCMRFAGLDRDVAAEANVEEFMHQAEDYREMIRESKWNRTLEFLMLSNVDHPLNAVRAYECAQWVKTGQYGQVLQALNAPAADDACGERIAMPQSSTFYLGRQVGEVVSMLQELGFRRVLPVSRVQPGLGVAEGQVLNLRIGTRQGFSAGESFPADGEIFVEYHTAGAQSYAPPGYTAQEPQAQSYAPPGYTPPASQSYAPPGYTPPAAQSYAPPGYTPPAPQSYAPYAAAGASMACMPAASISCLGRLYQEVYVELKNAGFTNVAADPRKKERKGILGKEGGITGITVNGQSFFSRGDWFPADVPILITYSTYADSGAGWY